MFAQSVGILPTHFDISAILHLLCCRPEFPPPLYPSLFSRISATMLVRRCLHRWYCLPSPLSRIDNMPSGWQLFPVNIFPVRYHHYNPFRYLRLPTSQLLPSHISSAAVSIPVVLHLLHHARPPLSSSLTLSTIPTSRVSVAVLIVLFSIVLCTSPLLFFYLLQLDLILALHRSVLHCLICSAPHYFSDSLIWSSH